MTVPGPEWLGTANIATSRQILHTQDCTCALSLAELPELIAWYNHPIILVADTALGSCASGQEANLVMMD